MAQVEFDIPNLSIVGKNVVESELNNNFFVQFLMHYNFWVQFLTYYKICLQMAEIQYFLPIILALFSILTHTDYSQNYSGIIRASLVCSAAYHIIHILNMTFTGKNGLMMMLLIFIATMMSMTRCILYCTCNG